MSTRLAASIVAGLLAPGLLAGALISLERAEVRVSVSPSHVQVGDVALTGLATSHIQASATESTTVLSSTRQLPATFATGRVYFWCSPMTSCPNGYTVPAGTLLGSVSGAKYVTEGSATFPSCQPSSLITVMAITPGSGGNAGAGTVLYGNLPGYIHVQNPGAIGGGNNARVVPFVQQSNIDAATARLTAKLQPELTQQLRSQAGLLSYLPVGSPTFTTTSSAHAGDAAPSVTVTVSGTLHAVAFSASSAQSVLRGFLQQRAPSGYALTSQRITATYAVDPQTSALTGSAAGYAVPAVDTPSLIEAMRGQDVSQATARLQRMVPDGQVNIRTAPFTMPWLPLLADHITVVVVANS